MNITLSRTKIVALLVSVIFLTPFALHAENKGNDIRVVSAAGALTEIIYQLEMDDQLIGVDTTSVFPEAATKLPQVGYQRALSAEGVLSLNPNLLLATEEAGPPAVIEQLKSTNLTVTIIPIEYSTAGVSAKIRAVATALNKEQEGRVLIESLENQMTSLKSRISERNTPPMRTIFIMNMGSGSPMVAGTHTAANAMINLSGGINPVTDYQGYKPINIESLIAINPEVILMTKRTLESMGGIDGITSRPGISMTDAGKNKHIAALDDLSVLGFTPRLAEAANTIYNAISKPAE